MKHNSFTKILDLRKYLDVSIFLSAYFLGLTLSDHSSIYRPYATLTGWVIFKVFFLACSGTYSNYWRYTSLKDLRHTMTYVAISDMAAVPLLVLSGFNLLEAIAITMVSTLGLVFARLWKRLSFERESEKAIELNGKRTLIIGLNNSAQLFAGRALKDHTLSLWPVGFVDSDSNSIGMTVEGIEVLGQITELEDICVRFKVQELVIAENKIEGDTLAQVLKVARGLKIRPRMLSGHGLESTESRKYELFKDVNLEDLLTRDKVVVDTQLLQEEIKGRSVLVTGAGGSIGSELCRQIMAMGPEKIILADHSEFNLYTIHKELSDRYPQLISKIIPVLLDVKDRKELELLFSQHEIHFVYHAAAYKHVHLVEMNPLVSIQNNISGTKNVLDVSQENNVERFVLISSDKAVNPTSVMGATKRICELLTTAAAMKTGKMYCSVRFGNVLGSSGSFIPLLKQQVRNGGPVTITDPRMQRYFMTIPEAVSLVLEASRISKPGDINVLKMGEPIMIVDIAKKIMTLMGKTEKEVPIVFTGIRPGEKLYEELYLCGDEVQTHHKDIVVLPKGDAFCFGSNPQQVVHQIEMMCELAINNQMQAVKILRQMVEDHKRNMPTETRPPEVAA